MTEPLFKMFPPQFVFLNSFVLQMGVFDKLQWYNLKKQTFKALPKK